MPTIKIPFGTKECEITTKNDELTVKFIPEAKNEPLEFKNGDFVFIPDTYQCFKIAGQENGCVAIYEKKIKTTHYLHLCQMHYGVQFGKFSTTSNKLRLATPEEKDFLLKEIQLAGFRWNSKTLKVEQVKWVPKFNEEYYFSLFDYVNYTNNTGQSFDKDAFAAGNYFKTENDAKAYQKALKKFTSDWRKNNLKY